MRVYYESIIIRAVEKGRITVLAAQSGHDMGQQTIRYIIKDSKGEKLKSEHILAIQILTQKNVKEYQKSKKLK